MILSDMTETNDKQTFEPSDLVEYGDAEQLTRVSGSDPASTDEGPQYTS